MSKHDLLQQAESALTLVRKRMASQYPFHAHLLSETRFMLDAQIETMAVTIRAGRLAILYQPRFVIKCSYDELMGVLHHEINHVLFGHLFYSPADYPNQHALIISQEVTVNEWVSEPLPGDPITLEHFPQLPPNEDTATRYLRLRDTVPSITSLSAAILLIPVPKSAAVGTEKQALGTKNSDSGPKNRFPSQVIPSQTSPNWSPTGQKSVPTPPQNSAQAASHADHTLLKTLDDHGIWQELREHVALHQLIVAESIKSAGNRLTPEEWRHVSPRVRAQLEKIAPVRPTSPLDWRQLLRRYVGQALENRPTFNRPPRRFPHLIGIVPGQGRRAMKPQVMAVIDSSGSMESHVLAMISGELARLARSQAVTVVECDARIHAVYPYRSVIKAIRGRGDTDFRPVFEPKFLARHRPNVLIYFTDGDGRVPSTRPFLPVIWCITPGGKQPCGWGNLITMRST